MGIWQKVLDWMAKRNRPDMSGIGNTRSNEAQHHFKKVVVVIIKPSQYDDDGFVHRYLRYVLPSNSLVTVTGLTAEALPQVVPEGAVYEIYMIDDGLAAHGRLLRRLAKRFPEEGTKLIVGLAGVQTCQLPRADALADEWQSKGAVVVIGGPHVTGSVTAMLDGIKRNSYEVPCPRRMPEEIQTLMDRGVVIFHGEAEPHDSGQNTWRDALLDIISGKQKAMYRGGHPALKDVPVRMASADYRRLFVPRVQAVEDGRGCPQKCTFCAQVNINGQRMRCRSADMMVDFVRRAADTGKRISMFVCGDNFGRNPYWKEIIAGFRGLKSEGYTIDLMIQCDLGKGLQPGFLAEISEFCHHIFFGVESVNPDNLADAGKGQNNPERYRELFDLCYQYGIVPHAAYIIGFNHDTVEGVKQDGAMLADLGAGQVSFYMLNPLPGSEDYIRMKVLDEWMTPEWGWYDSTHVTIHHPLMSPQEWRQAFWEAWRQFYRPSVLVRALQRFTNRQKRLRLLCNHIWYWWSIRAENTHPMVAGFYRLRPWRERRPDTFPLTYRRYLAQEIWRHVRYVGVFMAAFYVFQQVVFETECAPALSDKRERLSSDLRGAGDWVWRTFGPHASRVWLNRFWIRYGCQRWRLLHPLYWTWHVRMVPYAITEVWYTVRTAWIFPRLFKMMRQRV